MMQYLGVVEKRTAKLLQMWNDQQTERATNNDEFSATQTTVYTYIGHCHSILLEVHLSRPRIT